MEQPRISTRTDRAQNVASQAVGDPVAEHDTAAFSPQTKPRQVVCVSDSPQQAAVLESRIANLAGVSLRAIPSSAVQSAQAGPGQVFLVDVEFCSQPGRTIRDLHSRFGDAAVVAVLQVESEESVTFVLDAGVDDWFVLESATPEVLSHTVRHALARRHMKRSVGGDDNHDALLAGLARGVAHDVNNYLTAVTCGAELLSLREVDGGNTRNIENILQAARSAGELATDLLIAARPVTNAGSQVDPRQLLDRAVRLLNYSIRKAGVEIVEHLPAELPVIVGDPSDLTRRMLTLLARAIQRATPDQDIDIRSRCETGPAGGHWVLEMDAGGQRETLSVALSKPAASEYVQSKPAASPGTLRVLVVDDERPIRHFAAEALRSLGYEVQTACDGAEAVDLLRAEAGKVDLVMLDLVMPRMNGWEVVAELQRIHPEARVLISSGFDKMMNSSTRRKDLRVEFLAKPYGVAELQTSVEAALAGSPIGSA